MTEQSLAQALFKIEPFIPRGHGDQDDAPLVPGAVRRCAITRSLEPTEAQGDVGIDGGVLAQWRVRPFDPFDQLVCTPHGPMLLEQCAAREPRCFAGGGTDGNDLLGSVHHALESAFTKNRWEVDLLAIELHSIDLPELPVIGRGENHCSEFTGLALER